MLLVVCASPSSSFYWVNASIILFLLELTTKIELILIALFLSEKLQKNTTYAMYLLPVPSQRRSGLRDTWFLNWPRRVAHE